MHLPQQLFLLQRVRTDSRRASDDGASHERRTQEQKFAPKLSKDEKQKYFFEKKELKVILDLYAKMVSEGSWKDYGLSISSKQVSFIVFKNATENALYKICKNFKPKNKNLKYLITDTSGKILKNSFDLKILLKNTNWKKLQK